MSTSSNQNEFETSAERSFAQIVEPGNPVQVWLVFTTAIFNKIGKSGTSKINWLVCTKT